MNRSCESSPRASGSMGQRITVPPMTTAFQIVAGARLYRAAQLVELFSVPARMTTHRQGSRASDCCHNRLNTEKHLPDPRQRSASYHCEAWVSNPYGPDALTENDPT